MRRKLLSGIVLVVAVCPSLAVAQSSGGGTFGQRNLGSTLGGSSSSAFGGSSLGSSGSFGSGSGVGSSGMGAASTGQNAGQVSANDRFVRGARQPGQFVGSDRTDYAVVGQQNASGGLGGGAGMNSMMGRGGTNQLGGLFGQQGMNQFGRNQANQMQNNMGRGGQQSRPLRATMQIGFTRSAGASLRTTTQFERRLTKIPQLTVTGPVQVSMEGATAVLKGYVASERDRDLAEKLALLEPGIGDVRNELQIRPAADLPGAETIPTPEPAAEVTRPVDD